MTTAAPSAFNEIVDLNTNVADCCLAAAELSAALQGADLATDHVRTARRRMADAVGQLTRCADALAKAVAETGTPVE